MRPDWSTYFLNIAKGVAQRSTCPRALVGAVIVREHRILATGYNGAAPDEPHCIDEGCVIENEHCQRAIHAETNAVAQAARFGIPIDNGIVYIWSDPTYAPCDKCIQVMKAAGIGLTIDNRDELLVESATILPVEDTAGKEE